MSPALAGPVALVLLAAAVLIVFIGCTAAIRADDQAAFESDMADARRHFLDEDPPASYRDLIGAIPCDPRLRDRTRHVRMADLRSARMGAAPVRSAGVKLPARS